MSRGAAGGEAVHPRESAVSRVYFGREGIFASLSTDIARPCKRAHSKCRLSRVMRHVSHSNDQQKPMTTQTPASPRFGGAGGAGGGGSSAEKLPGEQNGSRHHRITVKRGQRQPVGRAQVTASRLSHPLFCDPGSQLSITAPLKAEARTSRVVDRQAVWFWILLESHL